MTRNKKRVKQIVIPYLLFIMVFFLTPSLAAVSLDELTATSLTSLPKELHEAPSIATHDRTVHVVWNTRLTEFTSQIYYKRSLDNGKTWGNTTKLSSNTTNALYPIIAVYNKTIHVVWTDYRHEKSELYYIRSTDKGETWASPQRLTYITNVTKDSKSNRTCYLYDVSIAVDHNNVYLVWKDYRTGSSEIFFKKSIDNGETWTDEQDLNFDIPPSYTPALAVQGSNIYVVYENWGKRANICLIKSTNYGDTWTEKQYLTDNESDGDSEKPVLAVMNNNPYLVWQDDRTGYKEIYFKKSLAEGESWGEMQQITFNSTLSTNPKIYLYDNRVIVIWQDKRNGSFDISYKTSADGGETWSNSQQLVSTHNCYNAEIVGKADNIHIIWQAYHGAGWADIWHMGNHSQKPIITNFMPSQTTLHLPGSVDITVDGEDSIYNKSELICNIQYLAPSSSDWKDLNVTFKNNQWEARLLLTETSKTGNYGIRTKLVNPEGSQSEWRVVADLLVSANEPSSETPGFEFICFILGTLILLIVYTTKWGKKRK